MFKHANIGVHDLQGVPWDLALPLFLGGPAGKGKKSTHTMSEHPTVRTGGQRRSTEAHRQEGDSVTSIIR